jgi:glucose-6-phosphate 1-dehydrogenase
MKYPISEQQAADLQKRFTYHAPKPDQPERYVALREKAKELATLVMTSVPAGREQATAITKIEEATFWANAGIARNE